MKFNCLHSVSIVWFITLIYFTNTSVYATDDLEPEINKLNDNNAKHDYFNFWRNRLGKSRKKRNAEDTTVSGATVSQTTTVPAVTMASNGAQAAVTTATMAPAANPNVVVVNSGGTVPNAGGSGWNDQKWGWNNGIGGSNNSAGGNWGMVDNSKPKTTSGLICSTDLFKRLDRCCPTPTLIGFSDIQHCAQRAMYRKRRAPQQYFGNRRMHIILYQGNRGNVRGKGRMGRRGRQGNRNGTWAAGNGGRSSWVTRGRTNINQVCLVDCVFRNLKWVSDDWTINANMMFATMAALVPPMWSTLINQARNDCLPLLQIDHTQQTMTATNGLVCLQFPTKMMRCVKRTLMLNCPTQVNGGPQCLDDVEMLKACDITSI